MPLDAANIPKEQTNLYLFVGAADSGKSYAATSFGLKSQKYGGDDPRPAYVLELDGRLDALRGRPVLYDHYTNVEGAIGVLERLKELREQCVKQNKAAFHTLILDSFTSFNDFSIADSLEITEIKQAAGQDVGRKRGSLTMMTTEDYGYEAEACRKLLWENITDLKKYCNVIMTAHEVEWYKPIKVKPGEPTRSELAGYKVLARDKISAKIPTRFDEIYHFLPKQVVVSEKRIRRHVVFQDMQARTAHAALATTEEHDISGQEFYTWWKAKLNGQPTPKENKSK